jgi:hypothetical protein
MNRNIILNSTIDKISGLPENKLEEVSDFVDFLLRKIENNNLSEGIKKLSTESKSLSFLYNEEDLYDESDILKA